MDSLKEDSLIYFNETCNVNIKAEVVVEKGLVHGSIRTRYMSDAACLAFKKACRKMISLNEF